MGMRMMNLAVHMGLSKKTLYNHFPGGKREIWQQCIERRLKRFAHRLLSIVDDMEGDYVDRGRDILNIGREAADVLYGSDGLITSGEESRIFFPELKSRYVRALTRFFDEGVSKGYLRSDLPVRSLAEVLVVLVVKWGDRDSTLSQGEVKSLPEFVEKVMFAGMLTETGLKDSLRIIEGRKA